MYRYKIDTSNGVFKTSLIATLLSLLQPMMATAMEEVTVVSSRDSQGILHSISATDRIEIGEVIPHSRNLADLISGTSGVELNGQGGALQAYSVRGVSRWRVQTRLGPALLNTDRRAGNSASFLDPWLMNNITIVKGPLATLYGSGSIGGLVSITPKKFSSNVLHASLFSNGYDKKLGLGLGNDIFSFGAVYQRNQRNEDPDGAELNDKKQQVAVSLGWQTDPDSTLQLIFTNGNDLGKSNSDFPDTRVTEYPREQHRLITWQKDWDAWDVSLYLHDQNLETQITNGTQLSAQTSESFDYGGLVQRIWQPGILDIRAGLDINGRADVLGEETQYNSETNELIEQTNLDGKQLISALLTDLQWQQESWILRGGFRWSHVKQKDRGRSETDTNVVGFIGASYSRNNWKLYSQVGNGFRFPELTEKFFIGTTSRGSVLGNPLLDPEKTTSLEIGAQISVQLFDVEVAIYNMRLTDYIERTTVTQTLRTYNNTSRVDLKGAEISIYGNHQKFSWQVIGHYIEGSSQDYYVADVPAPSVAIQMEYEIAGGSISAHYKHRFDWDNVNPSELPVSRAHLLSFRYRRPLSSRVDFALWCDNALNESYRLTTDELSALAPGRGFGISFTVQVE
jgi:outer membrane receptor protein involved in Fe transport